MGSGTAMPTGTSFRPIVYFPSAITRWSAVRASRQPPAGACPVMAATSGLSQAAMVRSRSRKLRQKCAMASRS